MKTPKETANEIMLDLQDKFIMFDLETLQTIAVWHVRKTMIEGDEINAYYYESVIIHIWSWE